MIPEAGQVNYKPASGFPARHIPGRIMVLGIGSGSEELLTCTTVIVAFQLRAVSMMSEIQIFIELSPVIE